MLYSTRFVIAPAKLLSELLLLDFLPGDLLETLGAPPKDWQGVSPAISFALHFPGRLHSHKGLATDK